MKRILLLGSTGSIGTNTLEVVSHHADEFEIVGMAARRSHGLLARQCDGLLLLTATPHDGYDPHFASIVELLDPSLVDGRGSLRHCTSTISSP